MIEIKEVLLSNIQAFWDEHIQYLIDDEMIQDKEELAYFSSKEYRTVLEEHMVRDQDKQHMVYFYKDGIKVGATSYCTYQSEDGKCFILDYWIYPEFRNRSIGHQCFKTLEAYTKEDGATYYMLNSEKENSVRFWKSLGFVEHGKDEYGMPLYIKQ